MIVAAVVSLCLFVSTVFCSSDSVNVFGKFELPHDNREVASKIAAILRDFPLRLVDIFFSEALQTDMLNELLKLMSTDVFLSTKVRLNRMESDLFNKNLESKFLHRRTSSLHLVLFRNGGTELSTFIQQFTRRTHAKHLVKMLFLFEDISPIGESWIENAFQQIWTQRYLNVVFIFWSTDSLKILTYSPFGGEFIKEISPNITTSGSLFVCKMNNMNKSRIKVSIFDSGVTMLNRQSFTFYSDSRLYETIEHKWNATFVAVPMIDNYDYGQVISKELVTGTLGQLARGDVEISFNRRFYRKHELDGVVEITYPIMRDDLCILVPQAPYQHSEKLFRNINNKVVIVFCVAVLNVYGIMWLGSLQQFNHNNVERRLTGIELMITICRWISNQSAPFIPRRLSIRLTAMFFMWMCLIMTNTFQGLLTTNLQFNVPATRIDSFNALAASNLKLITLNRFKKLLVDNLDVADSAQNTLIDRVVGVEMNEFQELIRTQNGTYAFVHKTNMLNLIKLEMRINAADANNDGDTHDKYNGYHLMKQCPVPYIVTYAFAIGTPFVGKFEASLLHLNEAGIIGLWDKRARASTKLAQDTNCKDNCTVVLGWIHLRTAFFLWLTGMIISSTVSLIEIIIVSKRVCTTNRIKMNNKRTMAMQLMCCSKK